MLARFLLGQIFGPASGTAVGGFAAEHASWRWPFGALAIWLAVAGILISTAARADPPPRATLQSHFSREAAGIFTSPWARVVVASVFTEGMLVFGALAFIPTHLHFERGVDLSTGGLALVPYALGGVVFALFAGRIVRILREVRLAAAGTVLLSVGCIVIAWSPHAAGAALGCLVAGLGFYGLKHTADQCHANGARAARRRDDALRFALLPRPIRGCGDRRRAGRANRHDDRDLRRGTGGDSRGIHLCKAAKVPRRARSLYDPAFRKR